MTSKLQNYNKKLNLKLKQVDTQCVNSTTPSYLASSSSIWIIMHFYILLFLTALRSSLHQLLHVLQITLQITDRNLIGMLYGKHSPFRFHSRFAQSLLFQQDLGINLSFKPRICNSFLKSMGISMKKLKKDRIKT